PCRFHQGHHQVTNFLYFYVQYVYTTDCKPPRHHNVLSHPALVTFLFCVCSSFISVGRMSGPSGSNGAAKLKRVLSLPGNCRCADCGAAGTPPILLFPSFFFAFFFV